MGLGGIALAPLMVDIKANIKGFKDDMSKASVAGVAEAKKISKELSNVTKVGEDLSKAGSNLTKFVSVPLAGVGVAAGKMAIDFESSFAKVSTLLDSNVVDFNVYKKDLLKASDDSKVAVGEFSEAVYGSISAGVDQTKAIGFTTEAMKLAKGGFTEGAKAVDVLTTAINGYGLTTEDTTKISDMLITTQNLGKTTVDELASSMGAVIPVASSVNFGIDELNASYAQLTKNGIATAESGTYLKSMLSELGKSGSITDKTLRELTGKGFADLKKEGKSTTEILGMINDEAKKNDKSLKDMFGSVEAGSAALVLMKGDGKEYNEMLDAMQNSAGAVQEAFDKMDATPAEQLKGALNKLKNAGIDLGIKLIPVATKIAEGISKVADKFSNLSDEQQNNILKWGGIAIAAGPVLKLIGGGISTFVKIKSAIGGVSAALGVFKVGAGAAATATAGVTTAAGTAAGATGLGGLAAGLGGAALAAAPFALAAAGVGVAAYGTYKVLSEDVIPTVDLFEDQVTISSANVTSAYGGMAAGIETETITISQATKDAVGAYMTMDDEMSRILYEQQITHSTITDEIATDTTTKFQAMADTIKNGQQTNYDSMMADYTNFFNENGVLTETREAEILGFVTQRHEERQGVVDNAMARITEIYTNAKEQGVSITDAEMQEINGLQEQMRGNAITSLSATEEEAAVIRARMKDYQGRLSSEMASEMIQKANEARDKEIAAANEKYDGVIKQATRMKEAGLISQEEYDDMVDCANRSKNDQIAAAEAGCDGIKNEIEKGNPKIYDTVDRQTGGIKSRWESAWSAVKSWWNSIWDMGSDTPNVDGGHYNGLSYVPKDGYIARLHKGERVLTAEENKGYSQGNVNNESTTINFNGSYGFNNKDDIDYFMNQAALKLRGGRG